MISQTFRGRDSIASAACFVLLAVAATSCGGDDSPAAGAAGQGAAGQGAAGQGGGGAAGDSGIAYGTPGPSCNGMAGNECQGESCCANILVPGGTFPMGDPSIMGATPEHTVTVSSFNLDKYEVTVGRFRKFVEAYSSFVISAGQGAHPLIPGSGWDSSWSRAKDQAGLQSLLKCDSTYGTWSDTVGGNENKPINCVDWYHAFLFCYWDGARLPTEAEWEYAAAGGDENRQYPWGSANPNLNSLAVFNCLADGSPEGQCSANDLPNVGHVPAGAGRWGHMDLGGSVREWGLDWQASYSEEPCVDCANVAPGYARVLRGGWWMIDSEYLQSAARYDNDPDERNVFSGFRCARAL